MRNQRSQQSTNDQQSRPHLRCKISSGLISGPIRSNTQQNRRSVFVCNVRQSNLAMFVLQNQVCFGFISLNGFTSRLSDMLGLSSLSLSKPDLQDIHKCTEKGQRLGFNHKWPGATKNAPPLLPNTFPGHKHGTNYIVPRWQVDHTRQQVGQGRTAYDKVISAVQQWKHMDLGWTTVHADRPAKGNLVCILPHIVIPWMKLPLQVTFVDQSKCRRQQQKGWTGQQLRFAHSTLHGHALAGEERFAVEWHQEDDSVWYEVYTVSRPATPLAAMSYPVIRLLQKRFASDSFRAMRAVAAA